MLELPIICGIKRWRAIAAKASNFILTPSSQAMRNRDGALSVSFLTCEAACRPFGHQRADGEGCLV
jgi:hypothetical protein